MQICLDQQFYFRNNLFRLDEIEKHLDWADNYGLSDDDQEGWEHCKELEKEREELQAEVKSLEKYINYQFTFSMNMFYNVFMLKSKLTNQLVIV